MLEKDKHTKLSIKYSLNKVWDTKFVLKYNKHLSMKCGDKHDDSSESRNLFYM